MQDLKSPNILLTADGHAKLADVVCPLLVSARLRLGHLYEDQGVARCALLKGCFFLLNVVGATMHGHKAGSHRNAPEKTPFLPHARSRLGELLGWQGSTLRFTLTSDHCSTPPALGLFP
jgi:hypothetical protein